MEAVSSPIRNISAVAVVLVLLLAACSSSPSSDAETGEAAPETLPFDALLIELFGTTDTDAYLAATERRASELIVECMEDAGFEFALPAEAPATQTPAPGDLDAARDIGFGIIAEYRTQLADIDLADPADPNLEYLSTLSASEIDRFFLTLEGSPAEPGQLPDAGCRVEASDEAFAEWTNFRETLPNHYVLDEERDSHPEWLEARQAWRECMSERGFEYPDPDAIRSAVVSTMRETVEQSYPGGQLPLVRVDGRFAVDPAVDELLDELAQFERSAAIANIECTEPLADDFAAVEELVQQDFVERNRQAVDSLLDS